MRKKNTREIDDFGQVSVNQNYRRILLSLIIIVESVAAVFYYCISIAIAYGANSVIASHVIPLGLPFPAVEPPAFPGRPLLPVQLRLRFW